MRILTSALLAFAVASCGSDNLNGTWKGTGSLTTSSGTALAYTATAVFNSSTKAYTLNLVITSFGDGTVDLGGTYTDDGTNVSLTTTTASSSLGTQDASPPKGYICLELPGDDLCFASPQKDPYTVNGSILQISVAYGSATNGVFAASTTSPTSATLTKS